MSQYPDHEPVKKGSDNIFADLGLPNAEELLTKSRLTIHIIEIVRKRKLSRLKVSKVLGISLAETSELMDGGIDDFSIEQLDLFLHRLSEEGAPSAKQKSRTYQYKEAHTRGHV